VPEKRGTKKFHLAVGAVSSGAEVRGEWPKRRRGRRTCTGVHTLSYVGEVGEPGGGQQNSVQRGGWEGRDRSGGKKKTDNINGAKVWSHSTGGKGSSGGC